jgi:effector-binding domain-containing protein
MQVKAVKPINFLFFRTETTVNQLVQFIPVGQELFSEAVRHNLAITGPIHWHYIGFEGDPGKVFTLEISLPIGDIANEYDGKFHFKRTEVFKCVTTTHEGNWLDIPQSYERLMKFIGENNLKPLALNREIYVNTDFKNPDANVTEIQIGIK